MSYIHYPHHRQVYKGNGFKKLLHDPLNLQLYQGYKKCIREIKETLLWRAVAAM
jgi:hypothetical protein